jgi:threonine dehydrogenase-like Zn-dependent dehydrogenase
MIGVVTKVLVTQVEFLTALYNDTKGGFGYAGKRLFFLPELIDLIWSRKINPGKVFDLTLPLEQVADGYRAMDERRTIKALLRP